MKRIVLGLAVLAAAAGTAAPASARVWVETCYQTIQMPCYLCVDEGPVATCVPI